MLSDIDSVKAEMLLSADASTKLCLCFTNTIYTVNVEKSRFHTSGTKTRLERIETVHKFQNVHRITAQFIQVSSKTGKNTIQKHFQCQRNHVWWQKRWGCRQQVKYESVQDKKRSQRKTKYSSPFCVHSSFSVHI